MIPHHGQIMISKKQVSLIRSLRQKKNRLSSGLFICEGVKTVHEVLTSDFSVVAVFGTREWSTLYSGLVKPPATFHLVTDDELARISALKAAHQVLALVRIPAYTFEATVLEREIVIGLDNIQDPGNLGTIIRLADWFNINHILCSESTADPFNPKVVQATMGSITRVQIHSVNLEQLLTGHPGIRVIATGNNGTDISRAPLPDHGLILFGNEASGISEHLMSKVKDRIFIPTCSPNPAVDSINVSMAVAIVLYELRRR